MAGVLSSVLINLMFPDTDCTQEPAILMFEQLLSLFTPSQTPTSQTHIIELFSLVPFKISLLLFSLYCVTHVHVFRSGILQCYSHFQVFTVVLSKYRYRRSVDHVDPWVCRSPQVLEDRLVPPNPLASQRAFRLYRLARLGCHYVLSSIVHWEMYLS